MTNTVTLREYRKPTFTKAVKLGAIVSASEMNASDLRLKRDLELLSRRDDGIGVYSYRYLLGEARYVGVLAQEVAAVRPDAVQANRDGFLAVDYSKLGMTLQLAA